MSKKFWQGIHPFIRPRGRKRGRGLLPPSLANGYAIGLTGAAPGFKSPPGVRVIPLPGIPPVIVGVAWAGKLSPIAHQFLAEVEIEATVLKRKRKLNLAANEHRRGEAICEKWKVKVEIKNSEDVNRLTSHVFPFTMKPRGFDAFPFLPQINRS